MGDALQSPHIRTGIGLVDKLRSHNVSNIGGSGIVVQHYYFIN